MFLAALILSAALLLFLVNLAIPPRRTRERMWRWLKDVADTFYGFALFALHLLAKLIRGAGRDDHHGSY